MKTKFFVVAVLALSIFSLWLQAESRAFYEPRSFVTKEGTLPYRILFPQNFDRNQKYPLILVLHGAGERGNDNELQLTHGSRLFLQENVRKNFPAIVVFPQCPSGAYWSNVKIPTGSKDRRTLTFPAGGEPTKAMKLLLGLIDDLLGESYVDKNRLYMGGLSMGGMGTFELLYRRPTLFAAAFPICGGGHPATINKYAKQVSLWVFHGAKDDLVPSCHSQVMVDALKKAGADVRFTLYPDVMHESWVPAFAEPELLPWLFSHTRNAQENGIPEWCKSQPRAAYKNLKRVNVPGETWFEVYEIQAGVFALYEPHQFEEVISYLIVGRQRALLFDTGMGIASIRKLVSRLTSLPVIVLNSHTHPDHIGGNHEFEKILAVDTNFTRTNSAGYRDPEMKSWVKDPNICGTLPSGFNADTYAIAPFRVTSFISDGETIALGNRKLQILLTPGHTPDSLCLLDAENKLLFTGDTFYLGPIYLYSPETNLQGYEDSVSRLAKLSSRVDFLLPAHNVPIASPDYLQKLKQAVRSVKDGKSKGVPAKEGLVQHSFKDFSLLLRGS